MAHETEHRGELFFPLLAEDREPIVEWRKLGGEKLQKFDERTDENDDFVLGPTTYAGHTGRTEKIRENRRTDYWGR